MAIKTHPIRLGVFIFFGSALITLAIFLIGNKESLFSETFLVKAYFRNIEGLRTGAAVRLSGIDVGSVRNINFTPDSLGLVEVTLRLDEDIHRFVKTDSRATIENEGLVGNKVVVLLIGSSTAPLVLDGGAIRGVDPLGFGQIIEETKGVMEYTKDMTKNLAEIVAKVNNGEGTLGMLINDPRLYHSSANLVQSADNSLQAITTKLDTVSLVVNSLLTGVQSIVSNVDKFVLSVDEIVQNVKKGKGLLGEFLVPESNTNQGFAAVLSNLVDISQSMRDGAERFSENMEALKRNWLFKSYFEQRGYYDKTTYENELDNYLKQINERIKSLDDKIDELKQLQKK